jgi:hypothetical protein
MIHSSFLSSIFSFAFGCHCRDLHGADYEVCRRPLCRLAWWLENLLWYGGEAGQ